MSIGELSLLRPACVAAFFRFVDLDDKNSYVLLHVRILESEEDFEDEFILAKDVDPQKECLFKVGEVVILTSENEIAGIVNECEGSLPLEVFYPMEEN